MRMLFPKNRRFRGAGRMVAIGLLGACPSPAFATDTAILDGSAGAIWTSVPTSIDRSKQNYERLPTLPDLYPLKLRAGPKVVVYDSGSFSVNGHTYVLDGVTLVPRTKICEDGDGRRIACGAKAAMQLRNVLKRGLLECKAKPVSLAVDLLDCRIGNQRLADRLAIENAGALSETLPRTTPKHPASGMPAPFDTAAFSTVGENVGDR